MQGSQCSPRAFWPPLVAGVALGLTLLLSFVLTGHGLGATGFFTRLTAWFGDSVAPAAMQSNAYLSPLLENGNPMADWITWQVIGVILGALFASMSAGRFKFQIEGAAKAGASNRLLFALAGGILAGFGARIASGCTSGMGLSGSATLAVAGFLFLGGFFAAGLAASYILRRARS